MGGGKEVERETRYIALRITEKQYSVWRGLPYGKSKLIAELVKSFSPKEKEEYARIQQTIIDLPPTLVEKRQIAVEKESGVEKEELMAFFGYIAKVLSETRGDEKKAVELIRRRLGLDGG